MQYMDNRIKSIYIITLRSGLKINNIIDPEGTILDTISAEILKAYDTRYCSSSEIITFVKEFVI